MDQKKLIKCQFDHDTSQNLALDQLDCQSLTFRNVNLFEKEDRTIYWSEDAISLSERVDWMIGLPV